MPRRVDAADAQRITGGASGATVGYHQPQRVPHPPIEVDDLPAGQIRRSEPSLARRRRL
jgi:hypothetical protein